MIGRPHHSVLVGSVEVSVVAAGADDTRTVMAIVALLAVVGVGLVMLAMWLFRVTRPDRELLAPLEVMGDRTWRRGDPVWQRRRLDEVRPVDAAPFRVAAAPPAIDESYDAGPTAPGFEDLSDSGDEIFSAPVDVPVDAEQVDAETDRADMADSSESGNEGAASGIEAPIDGDVVDAASTTNEGFTSTDIESGGATPAETDAGAASVPESVGDGSVDETADADGADDTIDAGVARERDSSLSDDVSSTPPLGAARSEFSASSLSADPDATLADLVAAAEDPPGGDVASDDPVRSGD